MYQIRLKRSLRSSLSEIEQSLSILRSAPCAHVCCAAAVIVEYVTYNREQTKIQTCYENTIQDNDTTTSPVYNLAFVLSSPGTPSVTAAEARTTVLRSFTFVTVKNKMR